MEIITASLTAHAIAIPSEVEVPLQGQDKKYIFFQKYINMFF